VRVGGAAAGIERVEAGEGVVLEWLDQDDAREVHAGARAWIPLRVRFAPSLPGLLVEESEEASREVAVGIDEAEALAQKEVLAQQELEKAALAGSGGPEEVEVAVEFLERERDGVPPGHRAGPFARAEVPGGGGRATRIRS
jgi:hypothetical protein